MFSCLSMLRRRSGPSTERPGLDVPTHVLSDYMESPRIAQDLRVVDKTGKHLMFVSKTELRRRQRLAAKDEFDTWLTSSESGHLLIHGNSSQKPHTSGMSLFCCFYWQVFSEFKPLRCIPLVFSCEHHAGMPDRLPSYNETQLTSGSPLPGYDKDCPPPSYMPTNTRACHMGGQALIRSLSYQLLEILHGQKVHMEHKTFMDIQFGKLDALCELFSRLLTLLPPDAIVWCLVDGVEYLERDGLWDDARVVFDLLVQLSSPAVSRTGASFRLLLTTPTYTSRMKKWFPGSRTVRMEDTGSEQAQVDSATLPSGQPSTSGQPEKQVEQTQGYYSSTPKP